MPKTGIYNVSTFTLALPDGNYLWNIQGCDADGNCGFATNNRTLMVGSYSENSQTFNNNTYETTNEQFIINLTYNSNNYGISGILVYNQTNYTGTISGSGNTIRFLRNIQCLNIRSSLITDDAMSEIGSASSTPAFRAISVRALARALVSFSQRVSGVARRRDGLAHGLQRLRHCRDDGQELCRDLQVRVVARRFVDRRTGSVSAALDPAADAIAATLSLIRCAGAAEGAKLRGRS
jgi:hypothetical protein